MGVSCPLCLSAEAFQGLTHLINALATEYICPICKIKTSEATLTDHLLNAHLQSSPCEPPPPPPPDPLDELLQDFSEFVKSEEEKVDIKVEESSKSSEPSSHGGEDINYEVFQATLSETPSEKNIISPPTPTILAAVHSVGPTLVQTLPPSSPPVVVVNKSVQCNICGWNFDNNNFLQLHLVLMHSDRPREESSSSSSDNVGSELPREYKCRFCTTAAYESFNDYVNHVQSVHNDYRYICHICSRMFKLRGSLLVHHRVVHTTARVVQSHLMKSSQPTSPPESGSPPSQETEEEEAPSPQSCTSSSVYKCPQCKKSFKREYHLNQHIKVHENRFWDCEVCHKSFTTKYFLKKHMRLHTGETPYTCSICGKSFTFQQSYHKHMLYHTDEKPYHCSQCGRAFKELSTLQNHERIHSGERPFACETCGKSFRQRVSYLVHRRIHTGVMPYSCEACGKSFRYKVTQRTHKCPNGGGTAPSNSCNSNGKTPFPELPPSIKSDLQKFRQQVQERRKSNQMHQKTSQTSTTREEEEVSKASLDQQPSNQPRSLLPNLPPIPLNLEDIFKDVCLYS